MKLQHVSVMFIIIFIPIILVTSYFINLQVNTIKLEASYDEKLLNATYDAMTAFELNTANEDLSSVSDSLRSIIEASNNIFFNTLCTNLGVSNASKSYIQPYIPAILYTLYDGYYIYSPTNMPEICTDKFGRTITTADYGVTYTNKTINGIGIYQFDQNSIVYSKITPTEPAENPAVAGDVLQTAPSVKFNALPKSIQSEYGQILYKNNDGTYSTRLHTWSGAKSSENYQKSTYYKRSYILKSYIPYSARYYEAHKYDITINYTLDNFMTIEGSIGDREVGNYRGSEDIYYTKSGYLIDKDLISSISVDGVKMTSWKSFSEELLDEYIHNPKDHEVIVNLSEGVRISNRDGSVDVRVRNDSGSLTNATETVYWDDAQSAVEYYVDSYIFSGWVYENLSGIEANKLKASYSVSDIASAIKDSKIESIDNNTKLYDNMFYNFSGDKTKPFDSTNNDPESEESNFYRHKRNVIKNSITYNLTLAMIVYTEESRTTEFNMPVLLESEWDRILNNVSITSFMEGMRCGLKYYNHYAIVTSTNNEISVTENEIYYVPRTLQTLDTNGDGVLDTQIVANIVDDNSEDGVGTYEIAHRLDCEELQLGVSPIVDNKYFWNNRWLGCISFKSKEIKYDKILNKDGSYTYDHKVYTDYNCIVDSNYQVHTDPGNENTKIDGNTDILEYLKANANSNGNDFQKGLHWKLTAYRIAVAKERNNLYKTTAFAENYGVQVVIGGLITDRGSVEYDITELGKQDLREIKKIEVTIDGTTTKSVGVYTDEITVRYDNGSVYSTKQTIATTSTSRRTLEFTENFDNTSPIREIIISAGRADTSFFVRAIKFYYK